MVIGQLAKPWISIPPKGYGGIERIIHFLVKELSLKENIVLFSSGDSKIDCNTNVCSLFETEQKDKGLDRNIELAQALHCVKECAKQNIDVLHAHSIDPLLALMNFIDIPCIFTFHSNPTKEGRILAQLSSLNTVFTFLTHYHKSMFPWIKNGIVIYPGIDLNRYDYYDTKLNYLSYVGRICEQKGVLDALNIARSSGLPIKVAGVARAEDENYFKDVLNAINEYKYAEFIGEVDDNARNNLVGNSMGFLFPISSGEAFGLVQIEAMALGTPVITYKIGAAQEIVVDRKTGFIVNSVKEAAEAASNLKNLNPLICRSHVEKNFSSIKMASAFHELYNNIIDTDVNNHTSQDALNL